MGDLPAGMTWAHAIGGLMILLGIGGAVIVVAELLCGMVDLPRRKPDTDASESEADAEFRRICEQVDAEAAAAAKQCEVRQLRAMTKHRTAGTDPLADTDALFAQIDEQIRAEAARSAKRCEVRR